jgi:hypothetical protein
VGWFTKYGLETSLQAVPRGSQLEVLLGVLERQEGATAALFK